MSELPIFSQLSDVLSTYLSSFQGANESSHSCIGYVRIILNTDLQNEDLICFIFASTPYLIVEELAAFFVFVLH